MSFACAHLAVLPTATVEQENSDKVILCAAALQDGELQRYLEVSEGAPLMFELTHAKTVPSATAGAETASTSSSGSVQSLLNSASAFARASPSSASGASSGNSSRRKKKRNRRRKKSKGGKGKARDRNDDGVDGSGNGVAGKVRANSTHSAASEESEDETRKANAAEFGATDETGAQAKTTGIASNSSFSPWKPEVETGVSSGAAAAAAAAVGSRPASTSAPAALAVSTASASTPVGRGRARANSATPTGSFVLKTSCGVLEFSGEGKDVAFLPRWMMQALLAEEGDCIHFKLRKFKPVSYIKLQPVG